MSQNIRATTQQHLDVQDITNNFIVLKSGSCAMVLQTNAINFGLLSEEEQDSTIYAYAALLNSLTFTVQILIRSELKDISGYLKLLDQQEAKQQNSLKKHQIGSYKNFIRSLVTERNVLEKKFYLIIPFSTLELGVTQSFASNFSPKKGLPFDQSYIVDKAKTNLEPKRDHLLRQLGRLGLSARQLNTQELIQLVFSMYNPGSVGQKITNTNDYTVPLVQPAYTPHKEVTMADQANPNINPAAPAPEAPAPAAPVAPAPEAPAPAAPAAPAPEAPAPAAPAAPAPEAPAPTSPATTDAADPQNAINTAASDMAEPEAAA